MPRRPSPRQPEFFVDRSLGRHVVPRVLVEQGVALHLMFKLYGDEETLDDADWIKDCGKNSWFILSKDKSFLRDVGRQRLRQFRAGAFVLGSGRLTGEQQAERYVHHLQRIYEICRTQRRPFLYVVHEEGLVLRWP